MKITKKNWKFWAIEYLDQYAGDLESSDMHKQVKKVEEVIKYIKTIKE